MQIILTHMPVIGNIIIYNEMTIFSKTFSSLLRNNVQITESIDILSKITNNEIYKEIMINTVNNIASGDKISEAFKDQWAVPDVAYYMIVTGESTGQLAEMMDTVAHHFQEQHRTIIGTLKSLIEPIMIVLLAGIVGIIVISILIPMFDMYESISM
jgi:type IV pilus assembly protein PilC